MPPMSDWHVSKKHVDSLRNGFCNARMNPQERHLLWPLALCDCLEQRRADASLPERRPSMEPLNRYPYKVEKKGGWAHLQATTIVITVLKKSASLALQQRWKELPQAKLLTEI